VSSFSPVERELPARLATRSQHAQGRTNTSPGRTPAPGSVPAQRASSHAAACRWDTIRYAIDSNARTVRLCAIVLVASIPPGLLILLIRR
jgi:hypothetical protein